MFYGFSFYRSKNEIGLDDRSQGCLDSCGEDFRKGRDPAEEQNCQRLCLRKCSLLIIQSKFWSEARA